MSDTGLFKYDQDPLFCSGTGEESWPAEVVTSFSYAATNPAGSDEFATGATGPEAILTFQTTLDSYDFSTGLSNTPPSTEYQKTFTSGSDSMTIFWNENTPGVYDFTSDSVATLENTFGVTTFVCVNPQ